MKTVCLNANDVKSKIQSNEFEGLVMVLDLSSENLADTISKVPAMFVRRLKLHKITPAGLSLVVKSFPNVSYVDITGNGIGCIPKAICMFRKLKTLVCKGVKVTEIPDWIGEMTNLTNIDLSCNKLTDISKLYRLSKLEKLDVSSNQIKDLDLGMFKSIKSINAFNNKITRIRNASDSKLVYLNLDRNDVKCADSLIENDTLEILNLSNNTDLEINSKSIGKSLNKLLLVNCSLTTIPEFVDSNINELAIETIDLSFNCFDDNYIESTKVIFKTNSDEDVFIILK